MRVGVAQIRQESNSFNPVLTGMADFHRYGVGRGQDVLSSYGDVDELGGFLEGLGAWAEPPEAVGVYRAVAWPGGPLSRHTAQSLRNAFAEALEAAMPLDGLLLSLHGALVSEDDTDVDGALLHTARAVIGAEATLVATLDLHAHCTETMLRHADAIVAYHTSPHLDLRQTGVRAARTMARIRAGARPVTASVRLPMISISEAQNTSGALLGPVFSRLVELESRPQVLSAAVLMTQGWLDVPTLGWSTLVICDGDPQTAQRMAEELAGECWARRAGMREAFRNPAQSVAEALRCAGAPVIIADGADATNSGAAGDSTHLLRELTAAGIPGGALATIVDGEAVAHARTVGKGGAFRFAVGGKRDKRFSQPLWVEGVVQDVRPARYTLSGHGGENIAIDMGQGAVIRTGDVTLLAVEHPGPGSTPLMYRCAGLEPKAFKIVVVKSPAGFRAEFGPFAAHIILVDAPGCASPRYADLPYTRIHRPLWPLDPIEDRHEAPWTRSAAPPPDSGEGCG